MTEWIKSSYSFSNSNCVEVAPGTSGMVVVRDSKQPRGPFLVFSGDEWAAFRDGVKAGEFDHPGERG